MDTEAAEDAVEGDPSSSAPSAGADKPVACESGCAALSEPAERGRGVIAENVRGAEAATYTGGLEFDALEREDDVYAELEADADADPDPDPDPECELNDGVDSAMLGVAKTLSRRGCGVVIFGRGRAVELMMERKKERR